MEIKHISKNELKQMFIEAQLENLIAMTLPEEIEKAICKIPKSRQKKAYENINELKRNPHIMFTELHETKRNEMPSEKKSNDMTTDYESENFKNFKKIYDKLTEFFDKNQDTIEQTYKNIYLEQRITLVVDK